MPSGNENGRSKQVVLQLGFLFYVEDDLIQGVTEEVRRYFYCFYAVEEKSPRDACRRGCTKTAYRCPPNSLMQVQVDESLCRVRSCLETSIVRQV